MDDSFADRMAAAGHAATADLSDGTRVAVELRSRLEREGLGCDEVWADGEGWSFFVASQSSPVCVSVNRAADVADGPWEVSAHYEGGLSSIWSEQTARAGTLLALRVQGLLRMHLRDLQARLPSVPRPAD